MKKLDSSDVIAAFNVNDEATRINESIDYLLNTARDKKNFIEYDQKLSFLEEALSKKEDVVSESKKEVFEKEKNDCIQAIDEAWEKADSTLRMKLTEIKDRLSKKEFSEITVDDDIKYINQLKETIA